MHIKMTSESHLFLIAKVQQQVTSPEFTQEICTDF